MTKRFELFLSQLRETNATLDYFVDFEKAITNVSKIEVKLNQLNYLIGKDNLKKAVSELYRENPKTFEVLDILIAIREKNKVKTFNKQGEIVFLNSYFSSLEKILEYIEETGLAEILQNKNITNLVDYVFGVEVGLDSNTRKNRGGVNMVKTVSALFDNANVYYEKEITSKKFIELKTLGVDVKCFDFVIKTQKKTYLIETNFYNTSGSKLNEIARAYSDIASKINQHKNYEFVWITDGRGWYSAKNKLEEAFSKIPSVYNLTSLKIFIKKIQSEGVKTF